jgi:hypothetical protein
VRSKVHARSWSQNNCRWCICEFSLTDRWVQCYVHVVSVVFYHVSCVLQPKSCLRAPGRTRITWMTCWKEPKVGNQSENASRVCSIHIHLRVLSRVDLQLYDWLQLIMIMNINCSAASGNCTFILERSRYIDIRINSRFLWHVLLKIECVTMSVRLLFL